MIYLTQLTQENFKETVKSGVVLVDAMADWCGPCKSLTPIVHQVGDEFGDKILVAILDVDKQQELCKELGIRNIPTLIYFKDGTEEMRTSGVQPKAKITENLNKLLF